MHDTPPPAPIRSASEWAAHLHAMSEPVLGAVPFDADPETRRAFVRSFRDEFGARGVAAVCVLAWTLRVQPGTEGFDEDPDTALWRVLLGGGQDPTPADPDPNGGLVAPEAYAIEHRTLIELSALHALTHLYDPPVHAALDDRLAALVDWHTRELQPDNAVNRPWAIHAFIARSIDARERDPDRALDALVHAQTLAHNCRISLGKPDLVSAIILRDAAGWLESRARSA